VPRVGIFWLVRDGGRRVLVTEHPVKKAGRQVRRGASGLSLGAPA
jgi:hypothetical protein